MTWWQAAILGLVQGLAEFLPISSSGHLVLGEYVLGLSGDAANDITFEVFVHFGTTLSIVTVYWRRILRLISGGLKALTQPSTWGESLRAGRIASISVPLGPSSSVMTYRRKMGTAPMRLETNHNPTPAVVNASRRVARP